MSMEEAMISWREDRIGRRVFRLIPYLLVLSLTAAPAILRASDIPCIWTGVEKIIAIGDLHGDCDNFVEILKGTGLVDEGLHWAAGTTHFIQTGDILDRGPAARKILDLLMRLEVEAALAGGKVHVLLGNHEIMNLIGIIFDYPGFVTVGQFLSFLPEEFRKSREREALKGDPREPPDALSDPEDLSPRWAEFWDRVLKTDKEAQAAYLSALLEEYGPWLLKKNCVEKINDVVFAHGGISLKYSTWELGRINDVLRDELSFLSAPVKSPQVLKLFRPQIIYDRIGPLWYRDLAQRDEVEFTPEVDRILANLNARYMVIAHTPQIGSPIAPEYMSHFQGRIWTIDTGISHYYGGSLSALIIDKGQFSVWGGNNE
jgi:hypothetical protein